MSRIFQAAEDRRTAYRVHGAGPRRVLLLHALTGGPDAADAPGVKGWWAPIFQAGAPLGPARATVWTPNLAGSCYGTSVPRPAAGYDTRFQAEVLAEWLRAEDLRFDVVLGASLGGMVALELALAEPDRFGAVAVVGCGARADAWLWGTTEIQRAILASPSLGDGEAISLARRAAMLTFRSPAGLAVRFDAAQPLRDWLAYHGQALAARFTRQAYLNLLEAMDAHDLGRGRGGVREALGRLRAPLHVLGLRPDHLISSSCLDELITSARDAGQLGHVAWVDSPHGHDAFLIEWDPVVAWLLEVLS
ncbi:alpha/beta fold hydrolase [Mesoterricola sediminis]|uniref:Homoserine O-acetyltransferase n=1 Tax=Mesoterricola sediminis TaxID=2927980 RepID=A0AA48KB02_9BACT|nr:alpha/beta fold hydrolase [Mesoterricola sediminis]BDU75261.1 homoserine O-acetyltransferase [Mesoterricola sediminis]